MKKKIITTVIVVVVFAAAVFAYTIFRQVQNAQAASGNYDTVQVQTGTLNATIDSTGVVRSSQSATLTWLTSGSVATINVGMGEEVKKGQVLAGLEQLSLQQNVILAQADLVSAKQALDDLLNSEIPKAEAQQAVEDAQSTLDSYYINFAVEQSQAQLAVANARDDLDNANRTWQNQQQGYRAGDATINAAEADLILAEDSLENAQAKYNEVSGLPDDDWRKASALSNLSAAQEQADSIRRSLNWYKGSPTDIDQAVMEADITAAQAALDEAEAEWERIQDGPAESDIALLEAKLADAQREWERVKDGPDPDDIAAAEARVAAAEATLAQIYIIAPFDGVITRVENNIGDPITTGTQAFRVDDLSNLMVDLQVSEVDITQIEIGQPVILTFDAIQDKEYQGEVIDVAMVGTDVGGIVYFDVTVTMTDADSDVKPGMTSAVSIVTFQVADTLLVPNRAIRVIDGERVVYIISEIQDPQGSETTASSDPRAFMMGIAGNDSLVGVQRVVITIGASSDSYSQLLSGDLKAGDQVILNPPSELQFNSGVGNGSPFGGR